jgi:outer membrane protease
LKSHTNIEWGYIIADKDYWDAVDADWYGRDSLPVAFDVKLSNYNVALPIGHKSSSFDAWEAFRMGYYYEGKLIKNQGFPQQAFKSGVGYKQDCVVSVVSVNISSRDTQINFNPIVVNSRDVNSYSSTAISSVAVNL